MAILLVEASEQRCIAALQAASGLIMSAGTLAECLIVAGRKGNGVEMAALIELLRIDIIPVTEAFARRAAAAHDRYGRGVHPAALNFGDCFAYALANEQGCPLLFVGDDFSKTDLTPASA